MRLSRLCAPIVKKPKNAETAIDGLSLLINAGYIRQSTSGVYNILPLGLRVQNKIEAIIRKHLNQADCVETSLASLQDTSLWQKTGRLDGTELFFASGAKDRVKHLLAPTAEEEVTQLVGSAVNSYRQLPLRLYQIGPKFRNEKRPRGGLLRAREFVMKDLYSFDESHSTALKSYTEIRNAYAEIFNELGVPYTVAEADTGTIGGSLSHEYHYLSPSGEDHVVRCDKCRYAANTERASYNASTEPITAEAKISVEYFLSEDQQTLVAAYFPKHRTVNRILVQAEMPLFGGIDNPVEEFAKNKSINKRLLRLIDPYVSDAANLPEPDEKLHISKPMTTTLTAAVTNVEPGDSCPECADGKLQFSRAIEVGHAFYLGTKYSEPLQATINTKQDTSAAIEMGCYGIGVSRLISAIVEMTKDADGLKWPKSVSPFDAVVIAYDDQLGADIVQQLNDAGVNSVLDDRSNQFSLLLGKCRLLGFPYMIIAGKKYVETGKVEIQYRDDRPSRSVGLSEISGVILGG